MLHVGSAAGESGPAIATICSPCTGSVHDAALYGVWANTAAYTAANALAAGGVYVDLHTAAGLRRRRTPCIYTSTVHADGTPT